MEIIANIKSICSGSLGVKAGSQCLENTADKYVIVVELV